jgi:NADH-ubiquinone oxidoreductase chain 6
MIKIYYLLSLLTIYSLLILISSIDYMTRLALLILVFILSGIIYMVLDFKFLGLTYIIVYVGAISILFLFVIMMTESGRTPNLVVSPLIKGTPKITFFKKAGLRLDLLLLFIVLFLSLIYFFPLHSTLYSTLIYNKLLSFPRNHLEIYSIYSPDYTTEIIFLGDLQSLGKMLYLEYFFIIILLGVLLWVTLIGILRISQK